MSSFTTIYRAGVMIGVGVVAYKGWQLYGPPTDKVKSVAARAVDMAQNAWKDYQKSDKDTRPAPEARGSAPPFSSQTLQPPAAAGSITAPPLSTQSTAPTSPAGSIPSATSAPPLMPTPVSQMPSASGPNARDPKNDRVQSLLSRLQQLGGSAPKVAAWGSSGHLYRCCCQAPLANSSAATQHFESVAAEPALAVEQVVAKVEAWRTAQRSGGLLRY
jgi:hypothetical protein